MSPSIGRSGSGAGRNVGSGARRPPRRHIAPVARGTRQEADTAARLDTVLVIAGRLAASHDREELFRTIVDETNRALRADGTTIRILRGERLEVAAWAGFTDEAARQLPSIGRDEGWTGSVLRTGQVLAIPDVRVTRRDTADPQPGPVEYVGVLIAPLIHRERVIGALTTNTREPRAWTPADVTFVSALASHAAIALPMRSSSSRPKPEPPSSRRSRPRPHA